MTAQDVQRPENNGKALSNAAFHFEETAKSIHAWNPSIDLLRILSALLVVFSHYYLLPPNFIWSGVHGVCVFFIVSGYCMGFSLKGRSCLQFISARLIRLLPALVFAILFTSAIENLFPHAAPDRLQTWKSTAANLACLPLGNIACDLGMLALQGTPITYSFVDGAYWSLLVEFRFYILLAVLFYMLKLDKQKIVLLLSGLSLFSLVQPFQHEYVSKSSDFFMYLPFFAFGIAYSVYKENRSVFLIAPPLISFALICAIGTDSISMQLNRGNAFSFALCFIIFHVMMSARIRYSGFLKLAGAISYPLYLLHQDIGHVISGVSNIEPVILAPLKILLIVVLAFFVHKFVENPARKAIEKIKSGFRLRRA